MKCIANYFNRDVKKVHIYVSGRSYSWFIGRECFNNSGHVILLIIIYFVRTSFFLFWCNLAFNYAMTSLKYGFLNEKGILLVKQCAYLQFALCAFMISLKCHLPRLNKKIVQFADHTFPLNPLSTRKQHHVL